MRVTVLISLGEKLFLEQISLHLAKSNKSELSRFSLTILKIFYVLSVLSRCYWRIYMETRKRNPNKRETRNDQRTMKQEYTNWPGSSSCRAEQSNCRKRWEHHINLKLLKVELIFAFVLENLGVNYWYWWRQIIIKTRCYLVLEGKTWRKTGNATFILWLAQPWPLQITYKI